LAAPAINNGAGLEFETAGWRTARRQPRAVACRRSIRASTRKADNQGAGKQPLWAIFNSHRFTSINEQHGAPKQSAFSPEKFPGACVIARSLSGSKAIQFYSARP
jgi:hypothetical protein